MLNNKLGVVIRHSGERTFDLLHGQFLSSDLKKNVSVVSSETFETTLFLSFQKALEMGKPWTLIIDADILVGYNFLPIINKAIKEGRKNELGFALRVFDKFYNSPKYRGIHIYQTCYLEKALNFIPAIGNTLRPESHVKDCMKDHGYFWSSYKNILGLHDFYQNPYDIFCKMAIRAHRSTKDVEHLLNHYNMKFKQGDTDFLYAKEGLKMGAKLGPEEIDNSRNKYKTHFKDIFEQIPNGVQRLNISSLDINKMLVKKIFSYSPRTLLRNFIHLH